MIRAARRVLALEVRRLPAALVDELASECAVAVVAGRVGQLDQRELDLLVAAVAAVVAPPAPNSSAIRSA